jgi:tRNA-Thr(GGU) m(6)t(6)A37 methyltransferase TsaA
VTIIQFAPVGFVRNTLHEAHRDTPWEKIESEIVVAEKWNDALDGITEFSHIWIVFHLDRVLPPNELRIRPMKRDAQSVPLVGIFATRSPQRPNPIGITPVELLSRQGNVLRVRGLDALDGTAVLDIKPYLALGDVIGNSRAADWVKQYWRNRV